MRCCSIAVLCLMVLAAPTGALAQATDSYEVNTPPAQPTSRARVDSAPTLLDRLFQQPQQPAPQPQAAAQPAAEPERNRRRAQRQTASRAEQRQRAQRAEPRRRAAFVAARQSAPAAAPQNDGPIPTPPPHPLRSAEEAVASVDANAVASAPGDTTERAYATADDPRERCHVVLASEAEHDFSEVLRCRVLMNR